ncbi:osm1 [Symbiodinium sp. KB8]|nr:osm1 [Symbiodinium sp. KB8]
MLEHWAEDYGDGVSCLAPASSIAGNIWAAKEEGCDGLGIASAGKMLESNATRDVDRLFKSFNLGMKLKREMMVFPTQDGESTMEMPWIKPSSWISYWLDNYPQLLCGTTAIELELEAFWLRKTIPVLLHGDEGRQIIADDCFEAEDKFKRASISE